jgi:hypothetical protein
MTLTPTRTHTHALHEHTPRLTQLALSSFEVLLKGSRERVHVDALRGAPEALFPEASVTRAAVGGSLAQFSAAAK